MAQRLDLHPLEDVAWQDGRWFAASSRPWLDCPALARWQGRWIELSYDSGLFDRVVRPLIRFTDAAGDYRIVPMNGAPTGSAKWIGPVPRGTVRVALSPAASVGPFSFRVTRVRVVRRLALVYRGLVRQPRLALMALGARIIGAREESRHCLKFASLGTALDDYSRWRAARQRPKDAKGFDRPHADQTTGPMVHILLDASGEPAAICDTCAALTAQSYPHWRLHEIDDAARQTLLAAIAGEEDMVLSLSAGDVLLPDALGQMVDRLRTHPGLSACYGDDEPVRGQPRLKPDFSPIFEVGAPHAGSGTLMRSCALMRHGMHTLGQAMNAGALLATLAAAEVGSVRRPTMRRGACLTPLSYRPPAIPSDLPPAAIIVPTRDRPELLTACLATIRATFYPDVQLILVDNGSVDPAALALLADAAMGQNCIVIRAPGPFNYAALCNAGASASAAPLLAFLNNDVSATASDWLIRLATRALQPWVGAVGPKLLFPGGRVQHAGVVVGLGETAQNAYRLAQDDGGYLGQLSHAREVGAVTGAVQVIERWKFDAVGGFDATHFPVLLNDIDLCLKLAMRGWVSVYEPAAVMIHRESASRGHSPRAIVQHMQERRDFTEQWLEWIRDDPFFHPALSLYAWQPRLG